jgi:hypothetical protein
VTVVLVTRDLLLGSRIADAAERAGRELLRIDDPFGLPAASAVDLVLVDWAARREGWGERLSSWCAEAPQMEGPRLVLYGPHTDLEAHAAARAAGLGPMWARSKLVAELPTLVADRSTPEGSG